MPKLQTKFKELKQKQDQQRSPPLETDSEGREAELKAKIEELQRAKKQEEARRRKQLTDIEGQIKMTEESNSPTEQMKDHELKMKDMQIKDLRRSSNRSKCPVTTV
jgi:hypothetical protein